MVIDADDFKKKLLTEAMRDGTYESAIKPQAIKDLEVGGEQFFPLELASLVHEESSMLAVSMRDEALRDGASHALRCHHPDGSVPLVTEIVDTVHPVALR